MGDDIVGVRVFNNASAINGSIASNRLIGGFRVVHGVAVDTGRNILYVSNESNSGSAIDVFDHADTVNGNAVPARRIMMLVDNRTFLTWGIFLDAAHDRLYVTSLDYTVRVFDAVSTANGSMPPTRTLAVPPVTTGIGFSSVFVDVANDRLYAVGISAIAVVQNVSTTSDASTAAVVFPPSLGDFTAVVVAP